MKPNNMNIVNKTIPSQLETKTVEKNDKKKPEYNSIDEIQPVKQVIPKNALPKAEPKPKPPINVKLTKKGEIDRRVQRGIENITKVREALDRAKKLKMEQKELDDDDSDDDEEEEFEYEIQPIKPVEDKVEPELSPVQEKVEPEVSPVKEKVDPEPIIEPYVQEITLTKKELEKLRLENEKLKSQYTFNEHMNRISSMARSMKIKF